MTLSFSTVWPKRMKDKAGKPNYFLYYIWMGLPKFPYDYIKPVPKILKGLNGINHPIEYYYHILFKNKFSFYWDDPSVDATWNEELRESSAWRSMPKLHTIREDSSDRWKFGMDIHFVINNRTKNRFQFAPVVKCVSVQEIEINRNYRLSDMRFGKDGWSLTGCNIHGENIIITVDKKELTWEAIQTLAINDGFDSVEDFFAYFNTDFKGKLIHWTDLKY